MGMLRPNSITMRLKGKRRLRGVFAGLLAAMTMVAEDALAALYLVQAGPGLTLDRLVALVTRPDIGGRVTSRISYESQGYIAVVVDLEPVGLRILNNTNSTFIESLLNYETGTIGKSLTNTCDSLPVPWSLDQIDGVTNGAYNAPVPAKPVNVYLLDSGITKGHCEFATAEAQGRLTFAPTFIPGDSTFVGDPLLSDALGHGTAVASCILGDRTGTATGKVTLHSFGVFGKTTLATSAAVVVALHEAVSDHSDRSDNGDPYDNASVINLSLVTETQQASCQVEDVIALALSRGITVVAAAGNKATPVVLASDCEGFSLGEDPEEGYSPARIDDVITVGAATDAGATWTVSQELGSNSGQAVDLYAPGAGIPCASTADAEAFHTSQSGTSYATGYVTGMAVNLLSCNPLAKPAQIEAALKATAGSGAKGILLARQGKEVPPIEASYADWIDAYGLIAPKETDDSDDLPLELEFFAGRNARIDDGTPVFWIESNSNSFEFFYEKARYVGPVMTQVVVEESSNLQNWSPVLVPATRVATDCFVETFKTSIPIDPENAPKYYRLHVTIQP